MLRIYAFYISYISYVSYSSHKNVLLWAGPELGGLVTLIMFDKRPYFLEQNRTRIYLLGYVKLN